jgi:hypothetical protein
VGIVVGSDNGMSSIVRCYSERSGTSIGAAHANYRLKWKKELALGSAAASIPAGSGLRRSRARRPSVVSVQAYAILEKKAS